MDEVFSRTPADNSRELLVKNTSDVKIRSGVCLNSFAVCLQTKDPKCGEGKPTGHPNNMAVLKYQMIRSNIDVRCLLYLARSRDIAIDVT